MFRISQQLSAELIGEIEHWIDQGEAAPWHLDVDKETHQVALCAYFETLQDANQGQELIQQQFSLGNLQLEEIPNQDWENEYKKYLEPWHYNQLHWVPVWLKEDYQLPTSAKAFYFDAEMAFGTGSHPSTRLCGQHLVDIIGTHKPTSLLDVGCGSGILTISAKLLGINDCLGIDISPDAVRVSQGNLVRNKLPETGINFKQANLAEGLEGTYPLVIANIEERILVPNLKYLKDSVEPNGMLILGGMLTEEAEAFEQALKSQLGDRLIHVEATHQDKWCAFKISLQ